jgi:hypothetical protein
LPPNAGRIEKRAKTADETGKPPGSAPYRLEAITIRRRFSCGSMNFDFPVAHSQLVKQYESLDASPPWRRIWCTL